MVESADEVAKRIKNKRNNYLETKKDKNNQTSNKISALFSQVLLAIIFFLGSAIYINYSTNNKKLYEKYVFTNSLSFQKFQNLYQKTFGKIIPATNDEPAATVFNENNNSTDIEISKYYDGVMLKYPSKQAINSLKGGIVVFNGTKDNYGNVLIVQGVDGADIWYGNISNISVALYDYVEENQVLGETTDNKAYIVINKDGNYLNYEEYTKQTEN